MIAPLPGSNPVPVHCVETFSHKTAVITGAAGGIGLALARRAATEGMNLVLADVDAPALERAARSLGIARERLLTKRIDVRHAPEIEALADAAWARFGAVHLLCNNAGVALGRVTWEHTRDDWEWVLGVNLWSVVHGVALFLPRMQATGAEAHIVNTASAAGLVSAPGMAAYNASKHAVVTLSETLYHELRMAKSSVDVSVLCPAWVPTGIFDSERNRPADAGESQPPGEISIAIARRIGKAVASGRLTADDMASATFDAVRERRFWIVPHRGINASIELRAQDILAQRNPTPTG
jgi:NAD(P)-dependent dehydrogenase (short-subunit alcohol dehydrogenase family)